MNINDDVIREWFYRLPKGYAEAPYSESELSVLADVIAEHDATIKKIIPEAVELVTEEDEVDDVQPSTETKPLGINASDWSEILIQISNAKSKLNEIAILAQATMDHYTPTWAKPLGFNDAGFMIFKNWKSYADKYLENLGQSSTGISAGLLVEYAISQLATEKGLDVAELAGAGATRKGVDVIIAGDDIEVKSSQKPSAVNLQLQTSFPKDNPDAYYIVASGTSTNDLNLLLVNSQLLRRALLGEELYDTKINAAALEKAIDNVLASYNLKDLLLKSIAGDDTSEIKKAYSLGNGVAINFKVFFSINSLRDLESAAKANNKG